MTPSARDPATSWAVTRRRVLGGLVSMAAAGLVLPPEWAVRVTRAAGPEDGPHRAVLRAYVSTLVPGPGDDPRGTPGGVEAESVEQLEAQVPYVLPALISDLTAAALARSGRDFASLPYTERESLLVEAFADPQRSPYHLIALAVGAGTFYGDFRNRVGGTHLGFPGPSEGYLDSYTDRTGHGQPEAEAVPR